jgi:hypothetical protein
VTTMTPINETAVERRDRVREAKRARDRERQRRKRAALGMQQRPAYEATSLTKARPWEAAGMSRATWYRKRTAMNETARETSVSPPPVGIEKGDGVVSTPSEAPREARKDQEGPEVAISATRAEASAAKPAPRASAGHRDFAILGGSNYPPSGLALAMEAKGITPAALVLTQLAETQRMIEARRSHRPGPRLREATK